MKKAKVILIVLVFFVGIGGLLAFEATGSYAERAFMTTDVLYTTVDGITYNAHEGTKGEFCTILRGVYIAPKLPGLNANIWRSTTMPAPRTVTFTAINGSKLTITQLVPFCVSTKTLITVVKEELGN